MELLMMFLQGVIVVLVPALTSALLYLFKKFIDEWIDKNTHGKTAEALKRGNEIIADSVNYIQQTYVDSLKKEENCLTKEAQEKALNDAKERAIELMGNSITSAIENNYGDLDKYIVTIIESLIAKKKS